MENRHKIFELLDIPHGYLEYIYLQIRPTEDTALTKTRFYWATSRVPWNRPYLLPLIKFQDIIDF